MVHRLGTYSSHIEFQETYRLLGSESRNLVLGCCKVPRFRILPGTRQGGTARNTFSIALRQTTQTAWLECNTLYAHSSQVAMCPHGTSSAERGASKQTAHGSRSSGGGGRWAVGAAQPQLFEEPPGCSSPGGLLSAEPAGNSCSLFSSCGEEGDNGDEEPSFLRNPDELERRNNDACIGFGQRSRWRDW